MTLRETIYTRCTTFAGIAALISTRCYPDRLPENVTYPALVYHAPISVNNSYNRTHGDGATERNKSRVQFDSYDITGDGASALADQVYLAWDGYSDDCDIGFAYQMNRTDTRADAINVYREISDFMIEHLVT